MKMDILSATPNGAGQIWIKEITNGEPGRPNGILDNVSILKPMLNLPLNLEV